jgi:hypothetical protein
VKRSARFFSIAALVATTAVAAIAWRSSPSEPQQGAPPSLVTPEHKLLEKYVGTWDAELAMPAPQGQPAVKSPGKSTCRLTGGGLWLVSDFESTFMGMPFSGHEVFGYDAHDKKYVLNWVDSMSSSFSTGDLSFDAKSRTFEGTIHGRDEKGAAITWRQADVWKDDDTRDWTMYSKGPDGKEAVELTIHYKRRK